MPLQSISLRHFRNIESLDVDCHPEFNFIFGHNAQGKTNLIEAISYLSTLKSFRTSNRTDLIRNSENFAKITGHYSGDDLTWQLDATLSSEGRQVLVNGKKPISRADYHALIPILLFEPRHIYLFRDSPSERRQYLNRALFLQNPGFMLLAQNYEKALTQKNKLLKDRGDPALIELWNEKLATLGGEIMAVRRRWFADLRIDLTREYQSLSGTRETFSLSYLPSQNLLSDVSDDDLTKTTAENILRQTLADRLRDECERREAFVGPHRDDFRATIDGRDVGSFGSQGENRSAIIALKLAQLKMYARTYGKTPLFLLDDVASELDENRCRYLFTYLQDATAQVFLTTPSNSLIHKEFHGHSHSFLVEQGSISVLT